MLDTYAPTGATPAKRDYHFPSPVGKMRPRSTVLSRVKGREEVEMTEEQEKQAGEEEEAGEKETMDHLDDDGTASDRSSLDSSGTAASVEDVALEVNENEEVSKEDVPPPTTKTTKTTAKTTKTTGIPRGGTKRGARRSLLKTKATRLPRKSIRGGNRALKEVKEN